MPFSQCRPLIKIYDFIINTIWDQPLSNRIYWFCAFQSNELTNRQFSPPVHSFILITYQTRYFICINPNGWANGKLLLMSSMPLNFMHCPVHTQSTLTYRSLHIFCFWFHLHSHIHILCFTIWRVYLPIVDCEKRQCRQRRRQQWYNNCAMTMCERT